MCTQVYLLYLFDGWQSISLISLSLTASTINSVSRNRSVKNVTWPMQIDAIITEPIQI